MTPEGKVKAKGRAVCKDMGCYFFPVNQGGFGNRGIPDDTVCLEGVFIHIEYKAEMDWRFSKTARKTLPTAQQVQRMQECRESGGITLVVDKNNIYALEGVLRRIRREVSLNTPLDAIANIAHRSHCGWVMSTRDYLKGAVD